MYTDVYRFQQPHNSPSAVPQPGYDGFPDAFQVLPFRKTNQHRDMVRTQNISFGQRPQQPQQSTAYPSQRLSRPLHEMATERSIPPLTVNAEHMLRRKTPNGTLAAGYDGRSTELEAKLRAAKHILMPAAETVEGIRQCREGLSAGQCSESSFGQNTLAHSPGGKGQQHYRNKLQPPPSKSFQLLSQDRSTEAVLDKTPMAYQGHGAPGVDSVLSQGSTFHPGLIPGDSHDVPTVLQPMWPPCLRSTSLDSTGRYGPYWPDGVFEPYRPAPLVDPRYPTYRRSSGIPGVASLQSGASNDWQRSSNGGSKPRWRSHGPSNNQHVPLTHPAAPSEPSIPFTNDLVIASQQPGQGRSQGQNRKPAPSVPGSLEGICQRSDYAAAPSEVGKPTTNQRELVQFKEKALCWAHRIYVCLLASIQQSRHSSSFNRSHGERQFHSSVYPKPPRQSSFPSAIPAHLESDNEHTYSSRNWKERRPQAPGLASGLTCSRGTNGHHEFSQPWESQSSYKWQLYKQQHHSVHAAQSRNAPGGTNSGGYDSVSTYPESSPVTAALSALELLSKLCHESGWQWIDGMLLGGCLAYGLGDYSRAMKWYSNVLCCDPSNVEAISNLAATLLSLNRRDEAEQYWRQSIALRPSYFEAVEHLVGLLCEDRRGKEAVKVIEFVEHALRVDRHLSSFESPVSTTDSVTERSLSPDAGFVEKSDFETSDPEAYQSHDSRRLSPARFTIGLSGYAIPNSDNGRILALVHGKGNMLYALGNNAGAAKAFEDAILIGSGKRHLGVRGLIKRILRVFGNQASIERLADQNSTVNDAPVLLMPEAALETKKMVFPPNGDLPGLEDITVEAPKRAAVSIVSNSLLSLAKIYQDGMSSSGATATGPRATSGVQDILALYYLSLSLQPSPSTANNVGILLASVQQATPLQKHRVMAKTEVPSFPGVAPGSGIALALAYYQYGLNLDSHHAHLYTNLGSLFKDIGQLDAAIKMYEKAVSCDSKFDIALANLANAVKDRGRISDAISYYKKAVASNPEFAEAVCGLANALNSVCNWSGRGGIRISSGSRDRWHVDEHGMLYDSKHSSNGSSGWIARVITIVERQLREGEWWGKGVLHNLDVERLLSQLNPIGSGHEQTDENAILLKTLHSWADEPWEGARVVRLIERATRRLVWRFYRRKYIDRKTCHLVNYVRPQLPSALAIPSAPTVLPFHTFTCPLTAKQIRRISQRNGLRISCSTLRAPWLPVHIYPPPPPPNPHLNVGYVSSDFNNHPLAHLMQSVFGLHSVRRVKAFCYAITASDGSVHRQQIEREAPVFYDASSWSIERLVRQIVSDNIHILINLNGYTRGARNEVFAARPAPVQMSFMGFAGTLGAEWCDYLLADTIAVPRQTLRPNRRNVDVMDQARDGNNDDDQDDWVYGENIIFTRDTFFCCDHRQSAPDADSGQLSWAEEQKRRWKMRKELFPGIADDTVILGNFNQLYKIEPGTFRTWLRILSRLPKAILWLLRFPELGESNLKQTALRWVGSEVASRIIFTDVAPKSQHIARARVCDLFLDTPECNAHTTAADVLWSGTPLLTLPRYEYKMCSRMAASILTGALPKTLQGEEAAQELITKDEEAYEERAIELGSDLVYQTGTDQTGEGRGRLVELRKMLYESRTSSALFDTRRWVRDLEDAYEKAWAYWVEGKGGDIYL